MVADIGAAGEDPCDEERGADSEPLKSNSEEEEESSGSEASSSSSSSDDDEDDSRPLSERASAQAAQRKPEGRKRVNRFPKIPKHMRCGRCENCLNPQRKKACIPARQRMEREMQQGGGGSVAATPPKPTAAKRPGEDPFTRSLTGILSSGGGVAQERHVGLLLQLVRRAASKPHRTALLLVLQLSAPEVQRQAVAAGLLLDLQAWLREFVAEGRQALVQKALGCLDRLPVTLAALQPPCELGKMVGRLRKHESFGSPVIEPAKRLVAKWKAVVEQSARGAGAHASSAAPAKAAPARPQPPAAARPQPPARAAPQPEKQSSGGSLAVGEDGDLFKGTDKQRTSIKEAGPPVKKAATVKTITVEPTRGRAAAGAASGPASAAPKGQASSQGAAGKAPPQTDVARVSASPFSALGGLGSGVTVVGGAGGSGLGLALPSVGSGFGGAKERAAAAARRVPSPEPQPRREKGKKVSWQKEDAMVGVRWFRKDDPPSAAQRDVAMEGPAAAAAAAAERAASPPRFESAAKKEHLSEAAALRQHRAEESEERHAMERRLEQMAPVAPWASPQPNDAVAAAQQDSAPPAAGEESTEAARAAAARHQEPAAAYAQLADVPDSPAEPLAAADCGQVQHPGTIPHMPLSLEAAAAMQQQQQQPWQPTGGPMQQQAPYSPAEPQPLQPQDNLVQPGGGQNAGLPDIGAALAQLAASGILASVPAPQGSSHPPPNHQPQAGQRGHAGVQQAAQSAQQWQGEGGRPAHGPPGPQRSHGQRPCRYFNTPKGCYMGDRCNFAHIPQPDTGQARHASGVKRPAADAGRLPSIWDRRGSFKRGRV